MALVKSTRSERVFLILLMRTPSSKRLELFSLGFPGQLNLCKRGINVNCQVFYRGPDDEMRGRKLLVCCQTLGPGLHTLAIGRLFWVVGPASDHTARTWLYLGQKSFGWARRSHLWPGSHLFPSLGLRSYICMMVVMLFCLLPRGTECPEAPWAWPPMQGVMSLHTWYSEYSASFAECGSGIRQKMGEGEGCENAPVS